MVSPILPVILAGVDEFLKILENHLGTIIVISVVIAVIVALVVKAAEVVMPVLRGILDVVKEVISGVLSVLATGGKAIGNWFSKLKPKTKAIIVSLILSLCSALLETGPKVFQTVGKLILGLTCRNK